MGDFVVGVVAYESRSAQRERLSTQVSPEIVNVDDGTLGAGGNHLAVLRALYARNEPGWLVVLEDDAQPVDGFRDQLGMALSVAPTRLASLYMGTGYPAQYQQKFIDSAQEDVCWLLHKQLRHAVGYAVHASIARGLLIRLEKLVSQRWAADDAISKWAVENREMVSYANPSLVDHEDGKTVIDYRMHLGYYQAPGRNRPRKAYKVGTRVTWDDTSVIVGPK